LGKPAQERRRAKDCRGSNCGVNLGAYFLKEKGYRSSVADERQGGSRTACSTATDPAKRSAYVGHPTNPHVGHMTYF
jgi:hypothetical protein